MITVNGVKRTLEQPLSVTEYLEKNQYVPVQVAIELNDQILARELYGSTILKEEGKTFFCASDVAKALRQRRKWKSILTSLGNIYRHISVRWK